MAVLVAVALAFLAPATAWTPLPSALTHGRGKLTSMAAGFGKATPPKSGGGSSKKGQEVEKLKLAAAAQVRALQRKEFMRLDSL